MYKTQQRKKKKRGCILWRNKEKKVEIMRKRNPLSKHKQKKDKEIYSIKRERKKRERSILWKNTEEKVEIHLVSANKRGQRHLLNEKRKRKQQWQNMKKVKKTLDEQTFFGGHLKKVSQMNLNILIYIICLMKIFFEDEVELTYGYWGSKKFRIFDMELFLPEFC